MALGRPMRMVPRGGRALPRAVSPAAPFPQYAADIREALVVLDAETAAASTNAFTGAIVEGMVALAVQASAMEATAARTESAALASVQDNAGAAPATLAFDTATPHQISINATLTRSVASGTTAKAMYRVTGDSTWIDGGPMYVNSTAGSICGMIIGRVPGVTYDVRLDITEPGVGSFQVPSASGTTHTTRALPAEGSTGSRLVNVANSSALVTALTNVQAGDVILLAAGNYSLSNRTWACPSGATVYLRGAARETTFIQGTANNAVFSQITGSNVVIEDLTLTGSGIDGGTAALNLGIGLTSSAQSNITVRRCTFNGFDRGIKAFDDTTGLMVYECQFIGNNSSSAITVMGGNGFLGGDTWNDDGVGMPGQGNTVWNCTFSGHGDTFKMANQNHTDSSRAIHVHHNWVKYGGDDGVEFDDARGNCSAYNNVFENTATALSGDCQGTGPYLYARNVIINAARHPFKLNSTSYGFWVLSNTLVLTNKMSSYNYGIYNAGIQNNDAKYFNNLLVYGGSGVLAVDSNDGGARITGGTNAWYPNRSFQFLGRASVWPTDIFLASGAPFAATIGLGSDYTTTYTGTCDVTLASGSTARNAGTAIAGITDDYSGAAPDIGAFITGQVFGPVGCEWDSVAPAWAVTAASQTWGIVPSNTLASIDPANNASLNPAGAGSTAPWQGNSGQVQVIGAWNGAQFDPATNRMWITAAGGHTDYGGNEVYCLDGSRDTAQWRLVRAPSGSLTVGPGITLNDGQEASGVYPDGRPRSNHTFGGAIYVPGVGPVQFGISAPYRTATGQNCRIVFFDEKTGEALFSSDFSSYMSGGALIAAGGDYDSKRRALWMFSNNTRAPVRYLLPALGSAPNTGTFSNRGGSGVGTQSSVACCYMPPFDCILIANDSANTGAGGSATWGVYDCNSETVYTPTFSGDYSNLRNISFTKPVWVPELGAVCMWNNTANRTLITRLTPPANPRTGTWVVDTLPVSGSNTVTPSSAAGNGAYGRFAYSRRLKGFLLYNAVSEQPYFYKL